MSETPFRRLPRSGVGERSTSLEMRQLLSGLAIQFDYTYDTQHFFDSAEKSAAGAGCQRLYQPHLRPAECHCPHRHEHLDGVVYGP